mgnify:CR=1 FL=1
MTKDEQEYYKNLGVVIHLAEVQYKYIQSLKRDCTSNTDHIVSRAMLRKFKRGDNKISIYAFKKLMAHYGKPDQCLPLSL